MFNRKLCSFEHEVFLTLRFVAFHYVEMTVFINCLKPIKNRSNSLKMVLVSAKFLLQPHSNM